MQSYQKKSEMVNGRIAIIDGGDAVGNSSARVKESVFSARNGGLPAAIMYDKLRKI